MQVGDSDAGGQDGVVGVLGGHGGRRLGRQVIQLDRGHARVQAADHLQRDGRLSNRQYQVMYLPLIAATEIYLFISTYDIHIGTIVAIT